MIYWAYGLLALWFLLIAFYAFYRTGLQKGLTIAAELSVEYTFKILSKELENLTKGFRLMDLAVKGNSDKLKALLSEFKKYES